VDDEKARKRDDNLSKESFNRTLCREGKEKTVALLKVTRNLNYLIQK
jgi:hypothetical protein